MASPPAPPARGGGAGAARGGPPPLFPPAAHPLPRAAARARLGAGRSGHGAGRGREPDRAIPRRPGAVSGEASRRRDQQDRRADQPQRNYPRRARGGGVKAEEASPYLAPEAALPY